MFPKYGNVYSTRPLLNHSTCSFEIFTKRLKLSWCTSQLWIYRPIMIYLISNRWIDENQVLAQISLLTRCASIIVSKQLLFTHKLSAWRCLSSWGRAGTFITNDAHSCIAMTKNVKDRKWKSINRTHTHTHTHTHTRIYIHTNTHLHTHTHTHKKQTHTNTPYTHGYVMLFA